MNTVGLNERTPVKAGGKDGRAPSIKYQPRSKRFYFDVGIGSVCLSGVDTGGAYCLLEVSAAPGVSVPRLAFGPAPAISVYSSMSANCNTTGWAQRLLRSIGM
jgi:hypothetical protein